MAETLTTSKTGHPFDCRCLSSSNSRHQDCAASPVTLQTTALSGVPHARSMFDFSMSSRIVYKEVISYLVIDAQLRLAGLALFKLLLDRFGFGVQVRQGGTNSSLR